MNKSKLIFLTYLWSTVTAIVVLIIGYMCKPTDNVELFDIYFFDFFEQFKGGDSADPINYARQFCQNIYDKLKILWLVIF